MNIDFSFNTVFPLIMAIFLIFLVPVMASRQGMSYREYVLSLFTGRKKRYDALEEEKRIRSGEKRKERHLFNGKPNEMMQLLSTLMIFARRNKLGLVYPGTIDNDGKIASIMCFVVTRSRVYGINCFGYAGVIKEGTGSKNWNQHINYQDVSIQSPVKMDEEQYRLVRDSMDRVGMKDVPLEILGVFTSRDAVLNNPATRDKVMTVKGLLEYLRGAIKDEEEKFDAFTVAKQIKELVKEIKPSKRR
ncbi:hypothetical protein [Oribacterium sp. P6A1]|uniref:hypothetical protein n=1 Tax=Oribacterium sp. P6A1 TaxID=1410612 RepID=UPI000A8CAD90|nr:hypothetical protein [Oribacterium sp. P6A1]